MANNKCVFVGNIPALVRWYDVKPIFQEFGEVSYVKVLPSKYNNRNQFGFVTFTEAESATRAVEAGKGGIYMRDRRLKVEPTKDKKSAQAVSGIKLSTNALFTKYLLSRKSKLKEEPEPTGPALIDNLDADCMLHIFSFLPLKDRIMCEHVCQAWEELSLKSWSSVKTIKMNDYFGFISIKDMIETLARTTGALTHLDLSCCIFPNVGEDLCSVLGVVSPNLSSLILCGQDRFVLTPKVLNVLSKNYPNLKALDVHNNTFTDLMITSALNRLVNLKELTFTYTDFTIECMQHMSNIRKLDLRGRNRYCGSVADALNEAISGMTSLEELNMSLEIFENGVKFKRPTLKSLTLITRTDTLLIDFAGLPNLEELAVKDYAYTKLIIGEENGKNLVKHCPKLKKLTIQTCKRFFLEADKCQAECHKSLTILTKLEHLSFLNITNVPMVLKDEVDTLAKFKALKTLVLRSSSKIDQEVIMYLINELAHLTLLDISDIRLNFPLLVSQGDIKKFCSKLPTDGERPTLELVIGGCGFKLGVECRSRWKSDRYIINESNQQCLYEITSSDVDSDSSVDSHSYGFYDDDLEYDISDDYGYQYSDDNPYDHFCYSSDSDEIWRPW